jgi:Tfp pilus assembly protein PilF
MREDRTKQPKPSRQQKMVSRTLVVALLIGAAGFLLYSKTLSHPFVYDDVVLVVKNQAIRSLSNIPEFIGFTDEGFQLKPRWTRHVTHALEYAAVGLSPGLYHAVNAMLHAAVALLVFLLMRRFSQNEMLAWWSAALFLVHPICTDVVAQVSGRRGLLAALFALGALLLLEGFMRSRGAWRLIGASLLLYLAAFSKETALLAPVAFVLLVLFRRPPVGLRELVTRHRTLFAVLGAVTAVLAIALLFFTSGRAGLRGSASFYDTSGAGLGVLHHARLIGMGLRLLLVPVGQTVDYSYDALGLQTGFWSGLAILDLAILIAAVVLCAWGVARRNWVGFGLLWYFLFFLPHMGLIPWHEVFAERFLYLPAIGLCVIAGSIIAALPAPAGRPLWARPSTVAGALVLILLASGTWVRLDVWSSPKALWQSAVERYPSCARAHKALADVYTDEVRTDLALEHYREAVRILPTYRDAHVGVATSLMAKRHWLPAKDEVEKIVERWPDDPMVLNLNGYLLETLGDDDGALAMFQQAVEVDPGFAEGYNNMGRILVERGEINAAIEVYEKALSINPEMTTALLNLAVIYRHALEDETTAAYYEQQAEKLDH